MASPGNPDSGLSFKEGDVMHVVDRESMEPDGWWLGLLLRGATAIQCGKLYRPVFYTTATFSFFILPLLS